MPRLEPTLLECARTNAVQAEALDDDAALSEAGSFPERVEKLERACAVGVSTSGCWRSDRDEVGTLESPSPIGVSRLTGSTISSSSS
jgi:hypothetical protein